MDNKYIHNNIIYENHYYNYLYRKKYLSNDLLLDINSNTINKNINEMYFLLKDNYDDLLLNSLTLIGTYYKINKLEDLFFKALENTNIITGDVNTYDLIVDYFPLLYNIDKNIKGCFIPEDIEIDYINKILYKEKDYIFLGFKNRNNLSILSSLIHELRHAVSCVNNDFLFIDDSKSYKRCGIHINMYSKNSDNSIDLNSQLDEFYNVYFQENILNEIVSYKKCNIENNNIKKFLNQIDLKKYFIDSYLYLRFALYPLLLNKDLTDIVSDVSINGNIKDFYLYFKNNNFNIMTFSNNVDNIKEKIDEVKEKSLILKNLGDRL